MIKELVFSISIFFALTMNGFAQNALSFDGTNDFVFAPNGGPTGSANRTIECWIKTTSSIAAQQVILDWGNMNIGERFTLNMINFGRIRIEVGGNGFNSSQSIADGNWHHIAITYDHAASLKFNMYIDGVLEANQNTTVAVNTGAASALQIGRRNDMTNYFNGSIDEVRIWNVARTPTEIQAAMNTEFCAIPPGLVSYYKFNQGIAGGNNSGQTTLTDAAGSNNGTLQNFALTGPSSNWVTGASLATGIGGSGSVIVSACDSYLSPGGNTYTTSGTYTDTILSAQGCDSILSIHLTLLQSSTGSMTATACNAYTVPSGNQTYTTSGTVTDTLTNAVGCDSIITIALTINTVDVDVIQNGAELSAVQAGATYQWLDCNNNYNAVPGATSQTFIPTANGNYAVQVGLNTCTDTSICYSVANVGLIENELLTGIKFYPNPAFKDLTISLPDQMTKALVQIIDTKGSVLLETEVLQHKKLELNLSPGMYVLKVSNGQIVLIEKLQVY
jgi:hypothetical protein